MTNCPIVISCDEAHVCLLERKSDPFVANEKVVSKHMHHIITSTSHWDLYSYCLKYIYPTHIDGLRINTRCRICICKEIWKYMQQMFIAVISGICEIWGAFFPPLIDIFPH